MTPVQTVSGPEASCLALFEEYGLMQCIEAVPAGAWWRVLEKFEEVLASHAFHADSEKNIFIDLFFNHCLSKIPTEAPVNDLWGVIEKWFHLRKLPLRSSAMPADEQAVVAYFSLTLRAKLRQWLLTNDYAVLTSLGEGFLNLMVCLWQQIFLNMFSPLQMYLDNSDEAGLDFYREKGFLGLLAASMYYPLDADRFPIDCEELFNSPLPLSCKNILLCWMLTIPYFNGEMRHRDRLVRNVPLICQALLKRPDLFNPAYFVGMVQELMANFWRASYIGGNNCAPLSAFGDFISTTIKRFCPPLPEPRLRPLPAGEKIRVGYISRNFFRQAVSFYMINRIIHHDRSAFEIFSYALGEHYDDFTELIEKNSDHFAQFPDLQNFAAIINSILVSKLDILIYTDIGMDSVTYVLAGLRLAPIQCAMVGHGTTTGLPTIDYYISGDFEADHAQEQYREKLICLPNLGAAQYLPDEPIAAITRKDLGIPEDAVLFISCANGIKHRADREKLYIEILQRAPNAWILLKPYTTPDGIDARLAKRIETLAVAAGVRDRLLLLSSIGHYRTVMGLLSIADIQLDTYPYGGWTTNMEALYCGLPIVTQEGELSRSRWGAGMLRALGIQHGIAANDEEFVNQAVMFAHDENLRNQTSALIKSRVRETLFNGPAAQPSFERILVKLARGDAPDYLATSASDRQFIKRLGHVSVCLPQHLYIATSISPRNPERQRNALATWQEAGFRILSLNTGEEITALQKEFPDVRFLAAPQNGSEQFGHPYVYFNDLLTCLLSTGSKVGGIINSDIHLINPALFDLVSQPKEHSLVFGSRVDVSTSSDRQGKLYDLGFDYFFFTRKLLTIFPPEPFCLGLPWWDFWAALIPLAAKHVIRRVITPAVVHVAHQAAWDKDHWYSLGNRMLAHVPAPFAVNADTMSHYLHFLARRINAEACDVIL